LQGPSVCRKIARADRNKLAVMLRNNLWSGLILLLCVDPGSAQQPGAFAAFEIASEAVLDDPHDLAIGPDKLLYVANKFAGEITVLDPDTLEIIGAFGNGSLFNVHDISFGPDGRAYVAVTGMDRVDVFEIDKDERVLMQRVGGMVRTEGAVAHTNGRLYVVAGGIGAVVAIERGEVINGVRGFFGAHDVEEAPDGTIWVADNASRRLVQLDAELNLIQILDDAEFGFIGPRYLDVDEFGRLVVADQDAHRILLIDPAAPVGSRLIGVLGDGTPGIGPGKFDDPEGVAIYGNSYFISDSDNNRIVKYSVVIN